MYWIFWVKFIFDVLEMLCVCVRECDFDIVSLSSLPLTLVHLPGIHSSIFFPLFSRQALSFGKRVERKTFQIFTEGIIIYKPLFYIRAHNMSSSTTVYTHPYCVSYRCLPCW